MASSGGMEERWHEIAGLRVRSLVAGRRRRRRPIVLVHGLGLAADSLRDLASRLGERHPVFVPDLPGFGESEHPPRALSIVGLSRALERWMRATSVDAALIAGNSYGAQVAAELAAREAGRTDDRLVSALALIGPTCDPDARSLRGQAVRWMKNSRADPAGGNPLELVRPYARAGFRRVLLTALSATRHHIEERLPQVRVPMLIIAGGRDAISPLAWNRRLVALAPDARLHLVEGGAHSMHGSHVDELAAAIAAFAATLPRAANQAPKRASSR